MYNTEIDGGDFDKTKTGQANHKKDTLGPESTKTYPVRLPWVELQLIVEFYFSDNMVKAACSPSQFI